MAKSRTDTQRVMAVRTVMDNLEKMPAILALTLTDSLDPGRFEAMQRTIEFTLIELGKAIR